MCRRVCYIALPFNRVRPELCLNVEHMEQIAEVLCSFGDSDEKLMSVEGELAWEEEEEWEPVPQEEEEEQKLVE